MIENAALALAVSYAPKDSRAAIEALFALDGLLAGIVRATTDPLIGQMRLTWWREALERLDGAPPPAEPVLSAIAEHVLPLGVTGAALAAITDGWEALLEEPFGGDAVERHAGRGAALFEAIAVVTGADDRAAVDAGRGWALADLAAHLRDPAGGAEAAARARPYLRAALAQRWSRAGRTIGALALLARQDLDRTAPVTRLGQLLWYRFTGR